MNHTTTINVWKGANRVSRLWEELAANSVPPDPWTGGLAAPQDGIPIPLEAAERQLEFTLPASLPGGWEESRENRFLEKVGQESIQWFRHAWEVLTAPVELEPLESSDQAGSLDALQIRPQIWEETSSLAEPMQADFLSPEIMIKVSSEPEPQPGSMIDTRRMVYGLKIPRKPLHKRPVYQRLLFCLRQWIARGNEMPTPR